MPERNLPRSYRVIRPATNAAVFPGLGRIHARGYTQR